MRGLEFGIRRVEITDAGQAIGVAAAGTRADIRRIQRQRAPVFRHAGVPVHARTGQFRERIVRVGIVGVELQRPRGFPRGLFDLRRRHGSVGALEQIENARQKTVRRA
jgi:hypothetical protein